MNPQLVAIATSSFPLNYGGNASTRQDSPSPGAAGRGAPELAQVERPDAPDRLRSAEFSNYFFKLNDLQKRSII
jgi:hypothetical protein